MTALRILAKRFARGDESKVTEVLHTVQVIVAVRMGDLAAVRHLVECAGMDVHTRDHVSCGCIDHA